MYSFIAGRLEDAGSASVVVSTAGIGYAITVPERLRRRLPSLGEEVKFHTHLHVREDELSLYGFASPAERELFVALIGISGVGPKLALAILGDEDFETILSGARAGDAAPLTRIKGVGKKTAERLVVELRDRDLDLVPVGSVALPRPGTPAEEAVLALQAMGLNTELALRAVESLEPDTREDRPVAEIVRLALRAVAG